MIISRDKIGGHQISLERENQEKNLEVEAVEIIINAEIMEDNEKDKGISINEILGNNIFNDQNREIINKEVNFNIITNSNPIHTSNIIRKEISKGEKMVEVDSNHVVVDTSGIEVVIVEDEVVVIVEDTAETVVDLMEDTLEVIMVVIVVDIAKWIVGVIVRWIVEVIAKWIVEDIVRWIVEDIARWIVEDPVNQNVEVIVIWIVVDMLQLTAVGTETDIMIAMIERENVIERENGIENVIDQDPGLETRSIVNELRKVECWN